MQTFWLVIATFLLQTLPSQPQLCGKTKYSAGLIVHGDEVKRGEFPFLVALIRLKDQKFFCGGNLITQQHVLTASHCIQDKFQPRLQPEDILAQLGRFQLSAVYEKGAVNKEIKEIHMHDDWKHYVERYDADIAVLMLESKTELSEYVQVVCLPTSMQTKDLIEGQVVGYGVSERTGFTTAEDTPRKVAIPKPPTNENCFLRDSSLINISSNRTFCGGGDGRGPCSGDSGGGFYVQRSSIWYLQGIVSASLINQAGQCDVSRYVSFTNVAFFVDWIWEKVNGFQSAALPCIFDFSDNLRDNPYFCETNFPVLTDDIVLTAVVGEHKAGKQIQDVRLLDMGPEDENGPNRDLHFIPSGIGDVFPNLRILYIQNCKLTRLSRKNFKRLSVLSTLSLTNNLIDHVDEDTFYEVPNLYSLRINGNRLKTVPVNLLLNAPRFQFFIFDTNKIEEFNGDQLFRKNPLLKWIVLEDNLLKKITITLASFKDLTKVDFENNKCLHARFGKGSTTTIAELQAIIKSNC